MDHAHGRRGRGDTDDRFWFRPRDYAIRSEQNPSTSLLFRHQNDDEIGLDDSLSGRGRDGNPLQAADLQALGSTSKPETTNPPLSKWRETGLPILPRPITANIF